MRSFHPVGPLLLLLMSPVMGEAQESGSVRFAVAGGPTLNDLEVGGMIWLGAAGAEWRPSTAPLVIDSSVRYLTFTAAEREHYVLAEVSAQAEIHLGSISPFLGAGVGFAWRLRPRGDAQDLSYHITTGLRARLGSRLGLRAEARLRSLEPLGDFTVGLTWRR